jgi:hypothetical protein
MHRGGRQLIYTLCDESGDLGVNLNNARTSRVFLITFLITGDKRYVGLVMKKTFSALIQSGKKRPTGVLHAYHEDDATRRRVLRLLSEKDIQIATIRLDKRKIFVLEEPHQLYSNMVIALINRLYNDGIFEAEEEINLIASQMHTNRLRNKEFLNLVEHGVNTPRFRVNTAKPFEEKGLQAVDFISWALCRKYERGDTEYADIISGNIVREYEFY